jgi:hypothetical protein
LLLVEDGRLRGQKRRRRTELPRLRRLGGLEAPSDRIQVAQTLSSIGTPVLEQFNEGGGGSGSGGGGCQAAGFAEGLEGLTDLWELLWSVVHRDPTRRGRRADALSRPRAEVGLRRGGGRVGDVGPKLPLRAHGGQRREHALAPADPTRCHDQRAGGGPGGYGGWVDTGWVIKKLFFWQKRSPNCNFYNCSTFLSSRNPTGGSDVRGTVGPIWVKKVFNCLRSL